MQTIYFGYHPCSGNLGVEINVSDVIAQIPTAPKTLNDFKMENGRTVYREEFLEPIVWDILLAHKKTRKYDMALKLAAIIPVVALIVGIARIILAVTSSDADYRFEDRKLHILRGVLETLHLGLILAVVDLILDQIQERSKAPSST